MDIESTQELNEQAEALKAAGKTDELKELAKRYGIEEEDVADFLDVGGHLTNPLTLALATIERERKTLNTKGVIDDWTGVLSSMAADSEELADSITFSGKSIKDLLGKILKQAFETKVRVNDDIAKAAGIRTPLYLGIPGIGDIKKLICEYYGVTV